MKGNYIAAIFQEPVADVIVGNVDGAVDAIHANVITRAQTKEKHIPPTIDKSIIDVQSSTIRDDFLMNQNNDDSLKVLWDRASQGTVEVKRKGLVSFIIKDKLLYKQFQPTDNPENIQHQLVVPTNQRKLVLDTAHSSPLAGHMSVRRTRHRVYSNFYWPGVDRDIKQFVKTCSICQKTKMPGKSGKAPLGEMEIITTPFLKVAIDIVGPLQLTQKKNRYILTLIDIATRWPDAVPLPDIETHTVVEALSAMFSRIGFPEQILSDNGPQFKSELYEQICRFFNVKPIKTTPYHPISNGAVERFNGTLKNMLRKLANNEITNWDTYLNAALFAYREIPNESTNVSPYELVFGRKVRGPMSILKHLFTDQFLETETKNVYEYLLDLKNRLATATQLALEHNQTSKRKSKTYYDKNAHDKHINEGDAVLVLKPQRQNKLSLHWDGPYIVQHKNSKLNVTIKKGKRLKTYHVNRLIKFHERTDAAIPVTKDSTNVLSASTASVITDIDLDENDSEDEIPTVHVAPDTDYTKEIKINPELTPLQKQQVHAIISQFSNIITDIPGKAKVKEFNMELTSNKPVTLKPYTVPIHMRDTLNAEIENMLKLDIIEESDSPYASPVVLVKKKDGSIRTCVDYRKLNSITQFDAEVIPDQEDVLLQLNAAQYFTKLDLTKGFWQLPIHERSRKFTAFRVPNGHYQFKYLPFGLVNSPSFFNRTMRSLLKGQSNVVFYFDDICIFNSNWQSHLETLRNVLMRLRDSGFTIKPNKMEVGYGNIKFLGHFVGGGVIRPDTSNIQKILDLKTPNTKKEVRSLLGLINYYNKFIPSFSSLVFPLTELLKKGMPGKIKWNPECEKALKEIQVLLSTEPILKLADPNIPFVLQTDASNKGIACCLMQEVNGILHPVTYLSRKLLPREQRYAVIERECLAIVWSIQKLSRYLRGTTFTIQCDHRPLTYLRNSTYTNSRISRWSLLLQDYNFTVTHISGVSNVGADVLSRLV